MELQNQLNGDLSRYFCNQQSVEDNNLIFSELQCAQVGMDGNSNPYCNLWMHSYSGSFAMDARIRLETLKSGSSSPVSSGTMNGPLYSYNYSKDIWDIGLNELSALDSVELLDVEEEEEDEESWLYVLPKKQNAFGERTEPALNWCRHVLDNPSPEMEAACRQLLNRLDLKMSSQNRHARLLQTGTFSVDSSMDQTSICHSFEYDENEMSPESSCYRLQNITDVYDIARLQEASLRQDLVYTPRSSESPLPPCFNTNKTNTVSENIIRGNKAEVSTNHSPDVLSSAHAPDGQSPKLTRLQQVTQYKLLQRAQNKGSSSRSSSPLRTSLRSLQAVRSSRSLDIDDYSLDHIIQPASGLSSSRTGPSSRSSSHSNSCLDSDLPVRSAAIKRCQRSHSLSPCRILALTSQGQVFASPERSRSAAWLRNARHPRR